MTGDAHLRGPPPLVVSEEATRFLFSISITGVPGRAAAAAQLTAQQIETSKVDVVITTPTILTAFIMFNFSDYVLPGQFVVGQEGSGGGDRLSSRRGHCPSQPQRAHAALIPAPCIEGGQRGLEEAARTAEAAQLDAGRFL